MKQRSTVLVAIALGCLATTAVAAEPPVALPTAPPSPIAIQACDGEVPGATVEYSLKGGEIFEGNCTMVDGRLVAVPITPIQTLKAEGHESAEGATKPQA